MTNFEFVFSLFGLLLGLALAEVLAGFGNALQSRKKHQVGWLTPLLGLFVALDLTSFWTLAWSVRDQIPTNYFSMMCVLLLTSLYYMVARIVFPRDADEWPDYDQYYFAHRKWVLGGVALCNLLASAAQTALGYNVFAIPLYTWGTVAFYAILLAAMFAPAKRTNIALLALISVLYPIIALTAIVMGV